ncbi:alpha/beta hydrolase [Pseudalkalibacillus caeni]|uniref:Alpha/beta hydrolase n=1 Tax=Exobacillus caeni TaxID=2574798 RepID=A0A5R9F7X6_9BACL|nr:alpha/beta hydrolase [Pseudalkalibacillus caeni]TLS36943.1 alpha/beta hydrolase [Pseudalkalibacillus caeni]
MGNIEKVVDRLSCWEEPISFQTPVEKTADIEAYLDFYGFDLKDIDLHFGKVDINETKIMAQIYVPRKSKGNIFLLHGYLDHVGTLKNVIKNLTKNHYTVISYDLQGHGLSGGDSASVADFSDYVKTLEKLISIAKNEMAEPFYIIGHSTGGAIAINYVLKNHDHHFKKVLLIAPLVRSNHWNLTKLGFHLMEPIPFLDDIRRKFRENSSDTAYISFMKNDPLQPAAIPLQWIDALMNWNKEIQTYSPTNTSACVIQGDKDKTVDWKHNLAFINEKFTQLEEHHIKNGRHALLNEKKEIRENVYARILRFLESN